MGRVKEALEGFLYYMEQDNRPVHELCPKSV